MIRNHPTPEGRELSKTLARWCDEGERKVLAFLVECSSDFGFFRFSAIASAIGLDAASVRDACRSLRQKGLAEYARGLFTEDGEMYGSGYAATDAGRAALSEGVENG